MSRRHCILAATMLAALGACVTVDQRPAAQGPDAASSEKPEADTTGHGWSHNLRGPQGGVVVYWDDPADSLFPPRAA